MPIADLAHAQSFEPFYGGDDLPIAVAKRASASSRPKVTAAEYAARGLESTVVLPDSMVSLDHVSFVVKGHQRLRAQRA